MLISLLCVICAFALFFFEPIPHTESTESLLSQIFLTAGGIVLIAAPVSTLLFTSQVQKMEKRIPGTTLAYKNHLFYPIAIFLLFFFPIFSFAAILGIQNLGLSLSYLVAIWLILLGMTIDSFYYLSTCSQRMANPFEVVEQLAKNGKRHLASGDSANFCRWINILSDVALKSIDKISLSLSDHSLNTLEQMFTEYLESRTLLSTKEEEEELNYTIYFLLQRMEQIGQKAIDAGWELLCSKIIFSLGKIAIVLSRYHPAWISLPINSLGKMATTAIKANYSNIGVKATITLQQIGKTVLEDDPTLQLPIQDLFFNILEKLEKIAQETFRTDKTTNINLLTQPFIEIKRWFTEEKYKDHPNAAVVVRDVDRIMGQFAALENILRTMPNIPKVSKEEEETKDIS